MNKGLRRGSLLFALLTALLLLAGCGGTESAPTPEPTPIEHVWESGVCTECGEVCIHKWKDGVCVICGMVCEHSWQDGVCTTCGMACAHTWEDGVCRVCGAVCAHEWEDGVCRVCGEVCAHTWEEGVCTICGLPCPHREHDPETRVCPDCGLTVPHEYYDGVCTRCGEEPHFITRMLEFPLDAKTVTDEKGTLDYYHYPLQEGEILPGRHPTVSVEDRRMRDIVVYTPYGYDENKSYNVLIIVPAAGHNAHQWMEWTNLVSTAAGRLKGYDILDRLIATEKIEPTIIAVVEYYLRGSPEEVAVEYARDLRERVLPFLAENYGTYASTDESGALIPAPEHYGFLGCSFGAMIGWQMLPESTDLFGYWSLLSGGFPNDDEILWRINAYVGEHNPILYLYAGDGKLAAAWEAYKGRIEKLSKYCRCLEEGVNMSFLALERLEHSYSSWDVGLYNSMQVFFHSRFDPEKLPPAESPKNTAK